MNWNSYEISLWSHQENLLAVLCNSSNFQKYDINSPKFDIKTTGQMNLTFSIPVIVCNIETGEWENNTTWYNSLKEQGNLANEKRVKLVFYDDSTGTKEISKIYEFVITQIQQSRQDQQTIANITCEGLAYHWLGKIGYNITFDTETLLNSIEDGEQVPDTTIDYWLDQVFPNTKQYDTKTEQWTGDFESWDTFWRYKINTNYRGSVKEASRKSYKVYQNDGIQSWTQTSIDDNGTPVYQAVYNTQPIEKQRTPQVTASNKYNITQTIAETFELYTKYYFLYEDQNNPYRATAGVVEFYNEQLNGGEYSISYGKNQVGVTKTSESTDIVTKMYVKTTNEDDATGQSINISEADANLMRQDYLLNFDYYINSNQMAEYQIKAIDSYKTNIRTINLQLEDAIAKRLEAQEQLNTKAKAKLKNAQDALTAAESVIENYNSKISLISKQSKETIFTMQNTPIAVDGDTTSGSVILGKQGVTDVISVTIKNKTYQNIPLTETTGESSGATISLVYDNYGFITRINYSGISNDDMIVYVTYEYDCLGYYNAIIDDYQEISQAKAKIISQMEALIGDETESKSVFSKCTTIDELKTKFEESSKTLADKYYYYQQLYNLIAVQKTKLQNQFEKTMGYFIRQGWWDATDVKQTLKTKQNYVTDWQPITNTQETFKGAQYYKCPQQNIFDEDYDDVTYYSIGEQSYIRRPYVVLTRTMMKTIANAPTKFAVRCKYLNNLEDNTDTLTLYDTFYGNGNGKVVLIKDSKNASDAYCFPAFLLLTTSKFGQSSDGYKYLSYQYTYDYTADDCKWQELTTDLLITKAIIKDDNGNLIGDDFTIDDNNALDDVQVIYRRIPITDEHLVDDVLNIWVKISEATQETQLISSQDFSFYSFDGYPTITLPISANVPLEFQSIRYQYQVSQTEQQTYYDAIDVLQQSSIPEVTYQVTFAALSRSLNNYDGQYTDDFELGSIVRINDWQLNLKNVKGIITQIQLDLDDASATAITVSNYKTQFQDLFGKIVASSESLQLNQSSYQAAANALTAGGTEIKASVLQNAIDNNALVFSSGIYSGVEQTEQGILITDLSGNTSGVQNQIWIKGSGIFLSNSVDSYGNRIYTSAITGNGINANTMNTGTLNTELISIYSGSQKRFSWTGQGLIAYDNDTENSVYRQIVFNQNGFDFQQGDNSLITLDWTGFAINSVNGYMKLTDDGMTISNPSWDEIAQDQNGDIELDEDGNPIVVHYTGHALMTVGKWTEGQAGNTTDLYGLRLFAYNTETSSWNTAVQLDKNGLFLQDTLLVGKQSSQSGITSIDLPNKNNEFTNEKDTKIRIWAGKEFSSRNDAPFKVYQDGRMVASSGTIGGWTISDNTLSCKAGENAPKIIVTDDDENELYSLGGDGGLSYKGASISTLLGSTTIINVALYYDKDLPQIVNVGQSHEFKITATLQKGTDSYTIDGCYYEWKYKDLSNDSNEWQLLEQKSNILDYTIASVPKVGITFLCTVKNGDVEECHNSMTFASIQTSEATSSTSYAIESSQLIAKKTVEAVYNEQTKAQQLVDKYVTTEITLTCKKTTGDQVVNHAVKWEYQLSSNESTITTFTQSESLEINLADISSGYRDYIYVTAFQEFDDNKIIRCSLIIPYSEIDPLSINIASNALAMAINQAGLKFDTNGLTLYGKGLTIYSSTEEKTTDDSIPSLKFDNSELTIGAWHVNANTIYALKQQKEDEEEEDDQEENYAEDIVGLYSGDDYGYNGSSIRYYAGAYEKDGTDENGNILKGRAYKFAVSSSGNVYASNIQLTGIVHAQGGQIVNDLHIGAELTNGILIHGRAVGDQDDISYIQSDNFISGLSSGRGWRIDNTGYAEFNDVKVRGVLQAVTFQHDIESYVAGNLVVAPSIMFDNSKFTQTTDGEKYTITINTITANEGKIILDQVSSSNPVIREVSINYHYSGSQTADQLTETQTEREQWVACSITPDQNDLVSTVSFIWQNSGIVTIDSVTLCFNASGVQIDGNNRYVAVYEKFKNDDGETNTDTYARFGYLEDIHDDNFGYLQGYGLYAKNAYLTGTVALPQAGITNQNQENDKNPIRFWAGASYADREDAPFIVRQNGAVTALDGTFEGDLTTSHIEIQTQYDETTDTNVGVFTIGDTFSITKTKTAESVVIKNLEVESWTDDSVNLPSTTYYSNGQTYGCKIQITDNGTMNFYCRYVSE